MKALLLKDMFTLGKQLRGFLILIVVFSCIPGYSVSSFAIVYAAMLPTTALAYDERSKWDSLAATMPYSTNSIVISKYLLGYLAVFGAALLSILAQTVANVVQHLPFEPEGLAALLATVCIATLLQAINLPFMFRLSVEKGRFVFLLLMTFFVVGGMAFGKQLIPLLQNQKSDLILFAVILVLVTVLINLISIFISKRVYRSKR